PRKGTMRGSGGAPAETARRSDHNPAHKMDQPARYEPPACATTLCPPSRRTALIVQPSAKVTSLRRSSCSIARATARKSTMPVPGECRAASPWHSGSMSRIAVGVSARLELGQSWQLIVPQGDDQLPAALVRDRVRVAELIHQPGALDAQPGLERAWLVVHAAVDYARVMARLVIANGGVLIDHDDFRPRAAAQHLACHGEPDDPGSYDGDVVPLRGHARSRASAGRSRSLLFTISGTPSLLCAPSRGGPGAASGSAAGPRRRLAAPA